MVGGAPTKARSARPPGSPMPAHTRSRSPPAVCPSFFCGSPRKSGTKRMCTAALTRERKLGPVRLTTLSAFGLDHIQPGTHRAQRPSALLFLIFDKKKQIFKKRRGPNHLNPRTSGLRAAWQAPLTSCRFFLTDMAEPRRSSLAQMTTATRRSSLAAQTQVLSQLEGLVDFSGDELAQLNRKWNEASADGSIDKESWPVE